MSKVNPPREAAARERRGLARDDIARAALDLLDEEGVDALSMRRLADRLGVGTMTLYGYFRSKDELLDAAVSEAAEDFVFTMPDGSLREKLRAHQQAARRLLARHPVIAQLRARQPVVQPAMFRITEGAMQILLEAGFPPDEAARVFRVLFVQVVGDALFNRDEPTAESRRRVRAALLSLPEEEFPAVTRAADGIAASTGGPEQFDYAMELILDGVEARAARHSAASSHQ
ncbi:MAG TPA: TetR/AcrR family transcriptional regulator C-terminal domain-containing protein [Solirubrobacteraceae bacterium]|nr:TetR/AcrR family transcriptional regulator C-terminal domain-containing protein [Solirubrobacteraceae bacterium]